MKFQTKSNDALAVSYFQSLLEHGDCPDFASMLHFNLGHLYMRGRVSGVAPDESNTLAHKHFQGSAELGDEDAMLIVGDLLFYKISMENTDGSENLLRAYDNYDRVAEPDIKTKLKNKIITLSEVTLSDSATYERFGEVILLMIRNILKKPQFSGYTFKDDFCSDAIYKILKYLHNFDHTLISKITNVPVNSFAYISQIIHNSVLFVINSKKKESQRLNEYVVQEQISNQSDTAEMGWYNSENGLGSTKPIITRMFDVTEDMNEFANSGDSDKSARLHQCTQDIIIENNVDFYEIRYPKNVSIDFIVPDNVKLIPAEAQA